MPPTLSDPSRPNLTDQTADTNPPARVQSVVFIGTSQTVRQAQRLVELAIPTQWQALGTILVGADPESDERRAVATVLVESKPRSTEPTVMQLTSSTTARARTTTHGLEDLSSRPLVFGEDATTTQRTLPALGSIDALESIAKATRIDVAIVCLPGAMSKAIARVRGLLRTLDIIERFVPPIAEMLERTPPYTIGMGQERSSSGTGNTGAVDPVQLLGRGARAPVPGAIGAVVGHKRVMVTGAGGSIGSEIARIVAENKPTTIILMERSENALFEIDRQIAQRFPHLDRHAVLNDVVDADLTLFHVRNLAPQIVFHAAAHKHVPLMEDHPAHAITNNLFGTKSVADAAAKAGCEKFVLISSDKAVNPTSVMGATKRLAELYVQGLHARLFEHASQTTASATPTKFSMVRFGNVLGSACSVLQIWAAQIAEGGPITITDQRMTRYFMTIPEAAALVIQAAGIESVSPRHALVHVLDMGDPVRIVDLAARFVRAMAFTPMIDAAPHDPMQCAHTLPTMQIRTTGARPGEKLHEELALAWETLEPTVVPGVRGWRGPELDRAMVEQMVADLDRARHQRDRAVVVNTIHRWVPNMQRAAA